jgi:signal transduction histidine kinase/DNA-binding response OmpR family regulator
MAQNIDKCILVVDDEIEVTHLCKSFLTRAGYKALSTNFPREAVEILGQEYVDMLLVDIRMPNMDGFQILKRARQLQPDIAVVTMTGYGTVETAVESLHHGADGMIIKPFAGAELVQSVESALQKRLREREIVRLQALRPLFTISEKLFSEKSPKLLRIRLLELVSQQLQCSHVSFYQRKSLSENWEQTDYLGISIDVIRHWPPQFDLTEINSFSLPEIDNPDVVEFYQLCDCGYLFSVPMNSENKQRVLIGARDMSNFQLGDVELETLRILSRQAIVALENAQLYDELQDHIRQVERSQRALIQAEKMAAVGRMTTSIAHEINNPLHSVQNCLHLAQRQELSAANREEYLEMAVDELDRLSNIVRQMLDFYRPSALDRKPTDINELINRVIKLLENQLNFKRIIIKKHLKKNLPSVLVVDNQIQQVFFNIFLNSMEAMPNGGTITLKTSSNQHDVSVLIEDSGTGIADSQRDNIFEPFVSYKEKGLGLGLTISYGIVTAHGGSLELMSSSGDGACFRLLLPAFHN